jgi:hypothetical protein
MPIKTIALMMLSSQTWCSNGAITYTSKSNEMFGVEFDDSVSTVINFKQIKIEICVNDGSHDVLE